MSQCDRDYEEFRREHQNKFDSDFDNWRATRSQAASGSSSESGREGGRGATSQTSPGATAAGKDEASKH